MVSGMFVSLGTDIADPLRRLESVRESTHSSKEFAQAIGARTLLDLAELMPGGLIGLGARTGARLSLANRTAPLFNTTVTNMPGPREPLYLAGAQLVTMYGIGMIVEGMGLIHPVMSYLRRPHHRVHRRTATCCPTPPSTPTASARPSRSWPKPSADAQLSK